MADKALELSGKNSVFSKKSAQNVGNAAPYIPKKWTTQVSDVNTFDPHPWTKY